MPEIIVAEHHEQVYGIWEERGNRDLKIAHVDFHCDMRGLLIDRPNGTAVFTSHRETQFIDRGNFLAHAVMNKIVTDLRWVHGEHGGRTFDDGPVVAYESDISAPLHKLVHQNSDRSAVEFEFEELLLDKWQGMRQDEQLDLDWDALASREFTVDYQEMMIEKFLSKNFDIIPEVTFLTYSPCSSRLDRERFQDFSKELVKKFGATKVELPVTELGNEGQTFSTIRNLVPQEAKDMKRQALMAWRKLTMSNDVKFYANR